MNNLEAIRKQYTLIVWGHQKVLHSHSFIHEAFTKAAERMGFDVGWFPDAPESASALNPDGYYIFICEGQCVEHLPWLKNGKYLLHNVDNHAVQQHDNWGKSFQTYMREDFDKMHVRSEQAKALNHFQWTENNTCFFSPWATDLMPDEMREEDVGAGWDESSYIAWVGTLNGTGTEFGNTSTVMPFLRAADSDNKGLVLFGPYPFEICDANGNIVDNKPPNPISAADNRQLVKSSFLAPSITGPWQERRGYIPCRIFKNISYGQLGITNSAAVLDVMEGYALQNSDTEALYHEAKEFILGKPEEALKMAKASFRIVKEKHTYVNRLTNMLLFLFDEDSK